MKLFLMIILINASTAKIFLNQLIPICDINDEKLNECVIKSANLLIPILSKGVKELNFPPIDPLRIPEMNIDQNNQPISLKLKLLNTIHTGLSTLKFHSASIDTNNDRWILNATLHKYSLVGAYKGSGRLLLIPIVGEGNTNFTYLNTKVDFVFDGNKKKQNEEIFFDLTNLKVYFTFDKCYVTISNLFGGSKQLSDVVSQFVNKNSKEVMNGVKDSLEKIYSSIYLDLVKKLLSKVPYSEIFQIQKNSN